MVINDVDTIKFCKWGSGEKFYRAVVILRGITSVGEHGRMERALHRRFTRARDARWYGERALDRLQRWMRYAEGCEQ
jgi:hemolysin-activating ACP:hemolysin acyltransferase